MPDLDPDVIAAAAVAPASATSDGNSATAHPLDKQIEADKYQRSNDLLTRPGGGWGGGAVKISRARGSGAVE